MPKSKFKGTPRIDAMQTGFHLRKVHPRNKKMYTTNEVNSSRVQVGCNMAAGIMGTRHEPQIHPTTRDPNL
ncbi:hypothetical protein E3N88_25591 [Mikania micrantha]|uniref:Uncharacterized protein n=1 Tax=Mikania micrantha TaxID=192012 RepID=A0A5N6N6T6_9ASTR|nr:hypothetical protein E3N88_25591 [Mikania micrantha]